jgi:hypothetical protein
VSASSNYIYGNGSATPPIKGRKTWKRPQAMLWSEAAPTIVGERLMPVGYEIGSSLSGRSGANQNDAFLILSDHNRSSLEVSTERIEQRQRMANGTMRSYHIADKLTISTSWDMLPSRSFKNRPDFSQLNGLPDIERSKVVDDDNNPVTPNESRLISSSGSRYVADQQYTVDGGAGGGEMLDWYENHRGPFWVLLSYDKYNNFGDDDAARTHLAEYTDARQMYISSFSYSVVKRGGNNFDMWDVSVSLEEV